jgi:hypothetical protein
MQAPIETIQEHGLMSRLDSDDGELAAQFRLLDDPSRRRLACAMVRSALAELSPPLALPQQAIALLNKAGTATPAQLAELDRRAASNGSGRAPDEDVFRRARIIAAARYALSPQPRAAEDAVYEAMHARSSFEAAMADVWKQLHHRTPSGQFTAVE